MRLEIMGAPDIVDGGLAHALALRHSPATPRRHPCRFGLQGCLYHLGDLADRIRGLSSAPWSDVSKTVPSSPKRVRQRITVFRFTERRFAIATSDSPAAAARTIRQRKATCCGVPCAEVHCRSFCCCNSEI